VFDEVAKTYDQTFTDTKIGRLLRNIVWEYLDKVLPDSGSLNILELNCGTCEDAIYLASKGHKVLATDISEQMIDVARKKVEENRLGNNVEVRICDARKLSDCGLQQGYDLVFSNFGGLNCLNREELKQLSSDLDHLIKPQGRFIAVIMPRFCVIESLYFLLKGKRSEIFRRNTNNSILANVDGMDVETWYYSPRKFVDIFSNHLKMVNSKPIGITIPPSYLEPLFDNKQGFLNFLSSCENILNNVSMLAACSDHFLIDLLKMGE
jgi:SAM-dependent methyltransferase